MRCGLQLSIKLRKINRDNTTVIINWAFCLKQHLETETVVEVVTVLLAYAGDTHSQSCPSLSSLHCGICYWSLIGLCRVLFKKATIL